MALSKLIENLDLVVGPFARTDIRDGWRLNLAEPGSVVLQFVLAGSAQLTHRYGEQTIGRGTIVMVPPRLAHSLQVGPQRNGCHANGSATQLPTGTMAPINLGDNGPESFVMVCGRVEATYGGMRGIFDAFEQAVIVDLANDPVAPLIFDALYREQQSANVGGCQMVSALMQQTFILMLRRLERDGFPGIESLAAMQQPNLAAVLDAIIDNPGAAHTVESLANAAGMSRSTFSAQFRQVLGRTPMDYVREVRLRSAAALLRRTDLGVEAIADKVGYASRTHFTKAFAQQFNLSPKEFRNAMLLDSRSPADAVT